MIKQTRVPKKHYSDLTPDQYEMYDARKRPGGRGRILKTLVATLLAYVAVSEIDIAQHKEVIPDNASAYIVEPSQCALSTLPPLDLNQRLTNNELLLFERVAIGSEADMGAVLNDINKAKSSKDAFIVLQEHLVNKGLSLFEGVPDYEGLSSGSGELKKIHIINLLKALYTLPKQVYETSGVRSLYLSPEIIALKTPEQRAVSGPSEQYFSAGGYYIHSSEAAIFSYGVLTTFRDAIDIVVHEVVGHGLFSKLCAGEIEKTFMALNESIVPGFTYLPTWKRGTDEQLAFYSMKIVTVSSYAADSLVEDIASTAASLFCNMQPYNDSNLNVVDEKQQALYSVLERHIPTLPLSMRLASLKCQAE